MPATDELSLAEQASLRDQCTVFLAGHGPVTPAGLLASIPADTAVDRYGSGGVVAELEAEVAALLGKPAVAFLPSGTMAQQSVLRIHADRRHSRTVIFHPMCHLDRHEGRAFERLHGLTGRPAGDPNRLMTLDDLAEIGEPPAALSCLRRRLPLMHEYLIHARDIAAAVRGVAGVRVIPDPPQAPDQVRDIITALVAP